MQQKATVYIFDLFTKREALIGRMSVPVLEWTKYILVSTTKSEGRYSCTMVPSRLGENEYIERVRSLVFSLIESWSIEDFLHHLAYRHLFHRVIEFPQSCNKFLGSLSCLVTGILR